MENHRQLSSKGVVTVLRVDGQELTFDFEICVADLLQTYPGHAVTHAGTLMHKRVCKLLSADTRLIFGELYLLFALQIQSAKHPETLPNLSELRDLPQTGVGSENNVNYLMVHQDFTPDQMYVENNGCSSRVTRATKPPRPSPLQLDVRGLGALSTSIKSPNYFKFSTSPTTNNSHSGAYRSSNYFSPILKRRSLGWSGQRLARIAETSGVCKTIGFAQS